MANRKPRSNKCDSMPLGQLLLVVRGWLFGRAGMNWMTNARAIAVLRSAASRGDNESCWLLTKMSGIPDFFGGGHVKLRWFINTLGREGDDSPCAKYYHGQALAEVREDGYLSMLTESAEAGFAPAMIELRSSEWIRRELSSTILLAFTGWRSRKRKKRDVLSCTTSLQL
jgi:hypothetical protein